MNEYLNMRTIFVVVSMIGLILLICMVYVRQTSKTYPGFNYWMLSSVLYFFGNFLFGFRGVWPDLISIVLANGLFMLLLWLIPYGIAVFAEQRHPIWPYLAPSIAMIIFAYYFSYVSPNTNARIVVFSVLFGAMATYAIILYKKVIPPFIQGSNLLLTAAFVFGTLWSLGRVVYTLFFELNVDSYLDSSIVQRASNLVYCGLYALSCFALCLLNFQRLEFDLTKTLREVKQLKGILPICTGCKKIRDDKGYWRQVELYINTHSDATFTHSLCPECLERMYPEYSDSDDSSES